MTYLINSTRLTRVLIGGSDFTDSVGEITLSDSSGIKNGLIATDGEIELGFRPGSPIRDDYRRNTFARGTPVDLFVGFPDGTELRHPRGKLYIIDSQFDPQEESFVLSVGCQMALNALNGTTADLKDLVNLYVPETREGYTSVSQALATEGKIAWYDNTGTLQCEEMWKGETQTSSPSAEWVSVFGVTCLAIASLDGRSIQSDRKKKGSPYDGGDPDNIDLDYDYTDGEIDPDTGEVDNPEDDDDKLEEEQTLIKSDYFVSYPAIYYERIPPEELQEEDDPEDPDEDPDDPADDDGMDDLGDPEDDLGLDDPRPSDCDTELTETENPAKGGNSDGDGGSGDGPTSGPGGTQNGDTNCMSKYRTARRPLYVGVSSRQETTTYYKGPAGARNRILMEKYGPALEANNQFFGDKFQLCRQSWATRCSPNGQCPTRDGEKMVLLERSDTRVEFSPDGAIIAEIRDTYKTRLSAAQPDDWRSSVEDGKIVGFRTPKNPYGMYRDQRVTVVYEYPKRGTKRTTTTYTSITSRGTGLGRNNAEMDALNGIVTTVVERSFSNVLNAEQPPNQADPEPPLESGNTQVNFPKHDKSGNPNSSGTFVYKETIPYPIMITKDSGLTKDGVLNKYEDYIRRCIKGSSLGLRIGEALRPEIVEAWKPTVSFRFYDPRYDTLISMRGDAHTWSLTTESCEFTVDGLNVGFSNGTVNIPDNLLGVTTAVL